jgi:RNA polymerase sigma factor (sigma-70 family)
MTPQLSDVRLARRAAKGDGRAFAAIYRRYDQRLYRYCLSIVGNPEDAQDALQNAMVKVMRALPGEQREIQLKPWLYRIAHNESVELLRKRREQVELDPELLNAAGDPAEAASQRERLRHLLADLDRLPERQRGALVMRELAGLGFEQIGEALGTSAAVVRQTVYEARLSLRQLEAGREMSCGKAMRELSDADGRVTRRRDIQAHLRACGDCREFGESIATRRRDLAAIAPLPAVASSALLHSVLGGSQAGVGGGLATGLGKAAAGSVAVKSAATVAVVAVLGVSAADRGGLIDVSGSGGGRMDAERVSTGSPSQPRAGTETGASKVGNGARGNGHAGNRPGNRVAAVTRAKAGSGSPPNSRADRAELPSAIDEPGSRELPAASNHGQETAAAHGGGRAQAGSKTGASKGHSNSHSHVPSLPPGQAKGHSESPGQAKGHSKVPGTPSTNFGRGSSANAHPPQSANPPPQDLGPDNSPKAPFQPSETPQGQGSPKS